MGDARNSMGKTTTARTKADTARKDTRKRPCTALGGGLANRSLLCGMYKTELKTAP
jgi:hypothetical protein